MNDMVRVLYDHDNALYSHAKSIKNLKCAIRSINRTNVIFSVFMVVAVYKIHKLEKKVEELEDNRR